MEQMKKMPLEGIRVVELATVVAAPTASRVLCAFGAEVIKVETKIGDEMRRAGEFEMVVCEDDKNPLFTIQNSGKRLTSIDLKNPDGKAAFLKLLETADVFLTNVRLPSLGRLGLDYETLHKAYPGLVYAHFSGFGPKGPDAAKPGFDSTAFWLRSGPMADWQVPGSFPFTPTYAFGDMATSSAFLSGILNYALFPAIGGRFFLYYCGFPETFRLLGIEFSTFGTLMALFLGVALVIVMTGGQLTTMITDCLQGIYSYFAYALLVGVILYTFSFRQFREVMLARPEGYSFLNPFDTGMMTDFNIFYVLIGIFYTIYCRMAWQGNQGYNSCGASPHEQKMGGVLGYWRAGFVTVMVPLLVYGAYTFLNHPDFAAQAGGGNAGGGGGGHSECAPTETIRNQMTVPVALRSIFPVGVTGVFCALALFLMLSTDTTYLHSWGSILVQDVILPFRRKPLSPGAHLALLRISIFAVAAFAWVFSFYFGQVTYILMFFAVTGTIYLGGAGSVIIGGLYWRRATTAGAWCAMCSGVVMGTLSFLLTKFWEDPIYPYLSDHHPDLLKQFALILEGAGSALPFVNWEMSPHRFPISGQEMFFASILLAIGSYILVSLLTCRKPFDLDRMLHRDSGAAAPPAPKEKKFRWSRLAGITAEYSRSDRILAWSVVIWTGYTFFIFLFQLIANTCFGFWSDETWFAWFEYYTIWLNLLIGAVTTVWFTWGGIRDLVRLFRQLKSLDRTADAEDDGRVAEHADTETESRKKMQSKEAAE